MNSEIENPVLIPSEILDAGSIVKLSTQDRFEYIKKAILKILYENRNRKPGIIETELINALDYKDNAIRRAIQNLLQLRDVYAVKHKNRKYLYLNGKVAHKIIGNDIVLGDKRYIFKVVANSRRKTHLFIQEKTIDFFGGEHNNAAIMIPMEYIDEFLTHMERIVEEARDFDQSLRNGKSEVIQ